MNFVIKTNYGYYEDAEYADQKYFRDHGIKVNNSSGPLGTTLLVGDVVPVFTQDKEKAFKSQTHLGERLDIILYWALSKKKEIKIELEGV